MGGAEAASRAPPLPRPGCAEWQLAVSGCSALGWVGPRTARRKVAMPKAPFSAGATEATAARGCCSLNSCHTSDSRTLVTPVTEASWWKRPPAAGPMCLGFTLKRAEHEPRAEAGLLHLSWGRQGPWPCVLSAWELRPAPHCPLAAPAGGLSPEDRRALLGEAVPHRHCCHRGCCHHGEWGGGEAPLGGCCPSAGPGS